MNKETLINEIVSIAQNNSFDGLNVDCIERDLEKLFEGKKVVKENELLHSVSVSFNSIETMLMGAVINAPIYKDGLGILQYDKFKPMLNKEWELLKKNSSR